jgi:hypothetical protein
MAQHLRQIAFTPRTSDGARPWIEVAALADDQRGVVSRSQLKERGISGPTITRWTQRGRLRRIHPQVYAFGHAQLTRVGWWHAALLACGDGAVLSHSTAAAHWALMPELGPVVHVTPASRRGHATTGIATHRPPARAEEVTRHEGIPVTTVARTVVDLAWQLGKGRLAEVVDRALLLRLYDHKQMQAALDRAHGRHGLKHLIPVIEQATPEGERFRSGTERRVRDRLVAAGLPRPLVNADVQDRYGRWHEVDLLWPARRLVVEIDGPQHRMPAQRAKDLERDAALTTHTVLRFPVEQIDADLGSVVVALRTRFEP